MFNNISINFTQNFAQKGVPYLWNQPKKVYKSLIVIFPGNKSGSRSDKEVLLRIGFGVPFRVLLYGLLLVGVDRCELMATRWFQTRNLRGHKILFFGKPWQKMIVLCIL